MDFAITFDPDFAHPDYAFGSIKIGTFTDYFRASTHLWGAEDYEVQWQEAMRLILSEGIPTALITDFYDPKSASFIMWWPLWRSEDHIIIQNQLLLLGELPTPFNLERPYEHVGEYPGNLSDNGGTISEWRIQDSDMKEFLEDHKFNNPSKPR